MAISVLICSASQWQAIDNLVGKHPWRPALFEFSFLLPKSGYSLPLRDKKSFEKR